MAPALAEINAAIASARDRDDRPTGLLRLAVSSIAEDVLAGELLATFRQAHPGVTLDIFVTDAELDLVANGFDAGVRLGESVELDMAFVPIDGGQRQIVVGSPAYLAAAGRPSHPGELVAHRCIGWRPSSEVAPYRWEFAEDAREFEVAVEPEVTSNDMGVMVRLALAGEGLTIGMEDTFAPWLRSGDLREVLADFCPPLPGFFLFYTSRRHQSPKLRAFVDHVRAWRRAHR